METVVKAALSNSDGQWKRFFRTLIITVSSLFAAGYLFILIVDPYGMLPLQFNFDRSPAGGDRRYWLPNMAKNSRFDSAIIGSSTIRLLNPDDLNLFLNGRFVNLGIEGASLFEQEAIFDVFLRNHPQPKTIIFGVDLAYFDPEHFGVVTKAEHFPAWMYDENPFNDLLPYNWRTIQITMRQFKYITGIRPKKFRSDGYHDFTMGRPYDIDRVRQDIYGSTTPKEKIPVEPPVLRTPEQNQAFNFPAVSHLGRMLGRLPQSTLKIVVIPPFHYYYQATPGSMNAIKWDVFKRRVADATCRHENALLFDFMIESPITTRDENYVDRTHYTVAVAQEIARLMAKGAFSQVDGPQFNRYCNDLNGTVN